MENKSCSKNDDISEETDTTLKLPNANATNEGTINKKQLFGIMGAIILFIGTFMPILSIPILGNMNYFQNGKGDGVIILILSVMSLTLVLTKVYEALWITGIGSLGVILTTFINLHLKISQMASDMKAQFADNIFSGLSDLATQSVQIQWGIAVLIVGAALTIVSAVIRDDSIQIKSVVSKNIKPVFLIIPIVFVVISIVFIFNKSGGFDVVDAQNKPSSVTNNNQETTEENPELIRETSYPYGEQKEKYHVVQNADGNYVRHGLYTCYYETGKKKAEGEYDSASSGDTIKGNTGILKAGREGKWTFWYESGQPASEINYHKGKKVDTAKYWYENGQMASLEYRNPTTEEGGFTTWCDDGKKYSQVAKVGQQIDAVIWYKNGKEMYIAAPVPDSLRAKVKGATEGEIWYYDNGNERISKYSINGKIVFSDSSIDAGQEQRFHQITKNLAVLLNFKEMD